MRHDRLQAPSPFPTPVIHSTLFSNPHHASFSSFVPAKYAHPPASAFARTQAQRRASHRASDAEGAAEILLPAQGQHQVCRRPGPRSGRAVFLEPLHVQVAGEEEDRREEHRQRLEWSEVLRGDERGQERRWERVLCVALVRHSCVTITPSRGRDGVPPHAFAYWNRPCLVSSGVGVRDGIGIVTERETLWILLDRFTSIQLSMLTRPHLDHLHRRRQTEFGIAIQSTTAAMLLDDIIWDFGLRNGLHLASALGPRSSHIPLHPSPGATSTHTKSCSTAFGCVYLSIDLNPPVDANRRWRDRNKSDHRQWGSLCPCRISTDPGFAARSSLRGLNSRVPETRSEANRTRRSAWPRRATTNTTTAVRRAPSRSSRKQQSYGYDDAKPQISTTFLGCRKCERRAVMARSKRRIGNCHY
ncbi:hypothetical protein MRB53_038145 [Persea americana]|nr:hypothetical protein MRB53_038145 [Persea americana]